MYQITKLCKVRLKNGIAGLISIHPENFFMLKRYVFFNTFSTQLEIFNTPSNFWKFQGVLKTMLKITRHVENHIENFKVCWKPCQNHCDVTVTWPFQCILYRTKRVKVKIRLSLKAIRFMWCYMCSLVEILYMLEEKLGLFVGNSCIISMLQTFFDSRLLWTLSIFFQIQ